MADLLNKTKQIEAPASVAAFLQPGEILAGKYKIVSAVGAGGMGTVYRVEQVFLNKVFALKILNSCRISELAVRRFQAEARAASLLNHPNLVQVHDFGLLDHGAPYLVMDFIDGVTLADQIKRDGPMSVEEAGPLFAQVCLVLAYAHEQGVIHRDIKPSNIMLVNGMAHGAEGSVKVVDFGIAKVISNEDGEIQALTRTGEIFGSPLYMSPEQCSGELVDHRSDIYSLGCVLFECLTGAPPHIGQNALATMMLHQSQPSLSLKQASLGKEFSPAVEKIVDKMLRKAPLERYQNLGLVAHSLASVGRAGAASEVGASRARLTKSANLISMPASRFYLLLASTVMVTAIVSGLGGYLLHQSQTSVHVAAKPIAPEFNCALLSDAHIPDVDKKLGEQFDAVFARRKEDKNAGIPGTLVFPSSSIGRLWISRGLFNTDKYYEAQGPVPVPVDAELTLELPVAGSVRENPSILEKVPSTNLSGLKIDGSIDQDSEVKWLLQVMQIAAAWSNLRSLTLDHCSINEAVTNALNNLKNLKNLRLNQCPVSVSSLSELRKYPWIERIVLSGTHTTKIEMEQLRKLDSRIQFL